jgi:hypothetical protein
MVEGWTWKQPVSQEYGSIFKVQQFGQNIVYLADPDDIRKYLELFPQISQHSPVLLAKLSIKI